MAVKDRRSGGRNWVPGLFAAFWILLAVFSAAYLFRIVTEPRSQTADSAAANPAATSATSPEPAAPSPTPSSVSADRAEALIQANEGKDKEIGELRASVQSLSGQVTELSNRLKPLEKVLGPVAALPSSTSVTTSPPSPDAMRPAERPPEPPKPSVTAAPPPRPPAVEAKPASQPKPPEKPVAEAPDEVRPAPEPAEDAASNDRDSNETPPSPVTADEPPDESTQTANLTPPSIPPGTTRFGIEIGSVGKQDDVRPMWRNLLTNHAALVAGLQARRVMAPDKKWRLIAGPFSSAAEAMQACGLFKKADMPCEATVFAGDAF
jgi:SPOR domain